MCVEASQAPHKAKSQHVATACRSGYQKNPPPVLLKISPHAACDVGQVLRQREKDIKQSCPEFVGAFFPGQAKPDWLDGFWNCRDLTC